MGFHLIFKRVDDILDFQEIYKKYKDLSLINKLIISIRYYYMPFMHPIF